MDRSPVTIPNFVLSSPSTCPVPSSLTSLHPHFIPLKLLFVPLIGYPTLPLPLSSLQVPKLQKIWVATEWCPDCCWSHSCGQPFVKVHCTCGNTFSFLECCFSFNVCLIQAGAAVVQATTHLDFVCLPIDFGVVFAKPMKSKNDVLLA
jgi:hypothetical protein